MLDHVKPDMKAALEKTFGPVAAVIRVSDEEEAVTVANATEFGLDAAVWTSDIGNGYRIAR
ncbi:hypothetical protein V461_06370 [Pantoea ananatis BRT98]|nr:hypothetical protein V461_06370 [Pantoea ananatis BRT98]